MAKRLGVGCRGFVAVTNVNDVVPEYLRTGVVRPRPSTPTISNAMDVGDPSNLARILALYGRDVDDLRKDLVGSVHDDDETRNCIAEVYRKTGYVLDPHSAVGYLGVEAGRRAFGEGPCVVLCTAHPVKFREAVEPAIGSSVPIPERLAACLEAERHVTAIAPEMSALREFLLEG
jgi:threonine synthase